MKPFQDDTAAPADMAGIRLSVGRPDRPWPLPERPQGYNPYMRADDRGLERWQEELERAKRKRMPIVTSQ